MSLFPLLSRKKRTSGLTMRQHIRIPHAGTNGGRSSRSRASNFGMICANAPDSEFDIEINSSKVWGALHHPDWSTTGGCLKWDRRRSSLTPPPSSFHCRNFAQNRD
jgi:hypothetical protein